MIPRAIVVWVLLVIGTILVSVQIGLKAEALDDDLLTVQRKQDVERDRIRVLRASYAYLTASDQLQPMVARHLALAPIHGDQMLTLAELPERTPVPVAPALEPGSHTPAVQAPGAIELPRATEAPERRQYQAPQGTQKNPPWLKAQGTPVLQPVSLPSQERPSP